MQNENRGKGRPDILWITTKETMSAENISRKNKLQEEKARKTKEHSATEPIGNRVMAELGTWI